MDRLKEHIGNKAAGTDGFWVRELDANELLMDPVRLNRFIICLCEAGTSIFFIDTKEYRIQGGDEVLLFQDVNLSIRECSPDFSVKMFIFSSAITDTAFMRFESVFFNSVYENPVFRHQEGQRNILESYFDIFSRLQDDFNNSYRNLIATNLLRSFCLGVYDKITRRKKRDDSPSVPRKEDIYGKFMNLLLANCRRHRDVAFYADRLCITPRYLSDVTQAISGDTPKANIDYAVVQEIKLMLTFSNMPIQEIADRMNFPDQSYLGRYFRRHTGMSPLQYRRTTPAM